MIGSTAFNGGIGRRVLNGRETAQYLRLEVDTVNKKARLRELPCVNVGRTLRFDLKALESFVEQRASISPSGTGDAFGGSRPANKTLDAFGNAAYSDLQA